MLIHPKVLIISNRFDFATDFIALRLRKLNVPFLRLNRDDLREYNVQFCPSIPSLVIECDGLKYEIKNETLASVYYRAPTFLREIFQEHVDAEEQLYRTQWAAFVRSLIVFEKAKWVNDPVATYKAEMKPFQLYYAKLLGFLVPESLITNNTTAVQIQAANLAVKSIDTAIISEGDSEAFVYTTLLPNNKLPREAYSSPFFIQQGLTPKIDVRITVIGDSLTAIHILGDEGIADDWRRYKGKIRYEIVDLPEDLVAKCFEFTKKLGLVYSAIDMVLYDGLYYFIEVNPTGEWAWLQQNTGHPFDEQIVETLL